MATLATELIARILLIGKYVKTVTMNLGIS